MTRTFVWAKFRKGRESRKRYSTCGFRFFFMFRAEQPRGQTAQCLDYGVNPVSLGLTGILVSRSQSGDGGPIVPHITFE
mgnify:CR=1 FL=1